MPIESSQFSFLAGVPVLDFSLALFFGVVCSIGLGYLWFWGISGVFRVVNFWQNC
jgi:hypothetical protein